MVREIKRSHIVSAGALALIVMAITSVRKPFRCAVCHHSSLWKGSCKEHEGTAGRCPNIVGVVDIEAPRPCHSRTIDVGSVAAPPAPVVPDGYDLIQATVHMRHLDRWMYRHDYIDNTCWAGQLDSTDPKMAAECDYNRSSVWEAFPFDSDPYARPPERGSCDARQLTRRGIRHAEDLGRAYLAMFPEERADEMCRGGSGSISLEADDAQKNQLTAQHVYRGMCGSSPSAAEFPEGRVLDRGDIERGRPFFLRTGICDSEFLRSALEEARVDFLREYAGRMRVVAEKVAAVTGRDGPVVADDDLATFLDNVDDCAMSHACHGLEDAPGDLWDLMDDVDELETLSRTYAFDYVEANGEEGEGGKFRRFVSSYFGYYFATVLHRMRLSLQEEDDNMDENPDPETNPPPFLYVQVTSDSIISPQLRILGAPRSALRLRPLWGSQIVYQLLRLHTTVNMTEERKSKATIFVRILYEGEVVRMQPLEAFANFVSIITPSEKDCPKFHDNFP